MKTFYFSLLIFLTLEISPKLILAQEFIRAITPNDWYPLFSFRTDSLFAYVGSTNILDENIGGVLRSSDNGKTWDALNFETLSEVRINVSGAYLYVAAT